MQETFEKSVRIARVAPSLVLHARCMRVSGWLFALILMVGAVASAAANDVQVEDAWIRWLPADIPAGGYMTLLNTGNADRVLVAVTSTDYGDIGIHESLVDHGVSKMRPVESITLKPHIPLRFREGGYHLMLMQPHRGIHPGDHVVMTLRFREGPPLDVVFAVRAGG
jgi:copper(I)-binding protein